jgi:hypothetical protein
MYLLSPGDLKYTEKYIMFRLIALLREFKFEYN